MIDKSNPDEFSIRLKKIRKVYNPERGKYLVAVDRVSFGVKNGECFTLLGVNGAGKYIITFNNNYNLMLSKYYHKLILCTG